MSSRKCVAIIGGGITGSTILSELAKNKDITVHLFDQGRRGVGGRTSSRKIISKDGQSVMRFDHGCQFFRADTPFVKEQIKEWLDMGIVKEWHGNFISSSDDGRKDFFGLPGSPPFYVGCNGMESITQTMLVHIIRDSKMDESCTEVFTGTRVAEMERGDDTNKWKLYGTTGTCAFHDTPEDIVKKMENKRLVLGNELGYDAVILTDVSSSFGKWHRASAGVPESFGQRVRERVGARVPLMTAMIAFESESKIPFDAATFDNRNIWFAARSNSKPGMDQDGMKECWTIISTPEYAMQKIKEVPMQDAKSGDFIPQSPEYLSQIPGKDLPNAFVEEITSKNGILNEKALKSLPEIIYVDAQRWGSALPCHRHLDEDSPTRQILSGVPYDSGRSPLAPTKCEKDGDTFLKDDELMLYQAGDMMSSYTPGFESAVISGIDVARHVSKTLQIDEK